MIICIYIYIWWPTSCWNVGSCLKDSPTKLLTRVFFKSQPTKLRFNWGYTPQQSTSRLKSCILFLLRFGVLFEKRIYYLSGDVTSLSREFTQTFGCVWQILAKTLTLPSTSSWSVMTCGISFPTLPVTQPLVYLICTKPVSKHNQTYHYSFIFVISAMQPYRGLSQECWLTW